MRIFFIIFCILSESFCIAQSKKIDPFLLKQLQLKNEIEYVILFDQTHIPLVNSYLSKIQKGKRVYELLNKNAKASQKEVVRYLNSKKIKHQSHLILNAISVKSSKSILFEIEKFEEVKKIITDFNIYKEQVHIENNSKLREVQPEWGIKMIQADSVWRTGISGQGVTIAGADTGYDWNVSPLKSKYRGYINDSMSNHSYNWHDAIKEKSPLYTDSLNPCGFNVKAPCDDDNHGTHTMGTMVGSDSMNQIGVAPQANWIACRNMERGYGKLSTYLECFDWFMAPTDTAGMNPEINKAPHVINNSWFCSLEEGCNITNWDALHVAVKNLKASGIVVVVSAGNNGSNCGSLNAPPAIFESSFSVGATAQNDTITSFSSRGTVNIDSSGRLKPDVSAPGRAIRSVVRAGAFASFSGTSMAGPHVAGTVALMISANPLLAGQVEDIENILEITADKKYSDQICGDFSGQLSPNPIYGYGRINALKAVEMAKTYTVNTVENNPDFTYVNIFPNPFENEIQMVTDSNQQEKIAIKIFDLTGKLLLSKDNLSTVETLDLSHLYRGSYFVKTTKGNKSEIRKIVKI